MPADNTQHLKEQTVAGDLNDALQRILGQPRERLSAGVLTQLGSGSSLLFFTNTDATNERASLLCGKEVKGDALFVRRRTGQHLFALMRPELIAAFGRTRPLSSDAFTLFGRHEAKKHNAEASAAHQHMLKTLLPELALKLDAGTVLVAHGARLCEMMHESGLPAFVLVFKVHHNSLRQALICAISECCASFAFRSGEPTGSNSSELLSCSLHTLILTEMVARYVKNAVRWRLRAVQDVDVRACHAVIIDYLHMVAADTTCLVPTLVIQVFSKTGRSNAFWSIMVPVGLTEKVRFLCN